MTAKSLPSPRFLRKTTLRPNEHNTNFVMLDNDIVEAISSAEADKVTPLMSKIYLRLKTAPPHLWERPGVLRFEGETREEKWIKAWDQLCKHLRVSSETANKALTWMHDQGIIGYSAFKNGIGIRIFLNRATSSIGIRANSGGKKILPFAPASEGERAASESETAFKDSYAGLEDSDSDLNPRAPKNGADTKRESKTSSDPTPNPTHTPRVSTEQEGREPACPEADAPSATALDEIMRRVQTEVEQWVKTAAVEAAAREHERTRDWLDKYGIPKATRVAQHEAYKVLKSHGVISASDGRRRAESEVGRPSDAYAPPRAHPLSAEEIAETAGMCVALLETQGKSVEVTLSEISSEGGGWLLPEDTPKVREATQALMLLRGERR